ncbi:MAG: hypothetical protein ABSF83_00545 [Nitrososphaerales archaeon]|jgi:predicted DNA-binding transcriptional regulator
MQLVIKSEKVRRSVEFEVPLMTRWGNVGVEKKRAIVYDYVLDETQKLALDEARELARERCLALKVTDLSRQGLLRRTVASGMDRIGGRVWSRPNTLFAAPQDCRG